MAALTNNSTSRCWCFTLNGTHDYAKLDAVKKWSYMVAGREHADTTGKKHLQCFVIYEKRTKFSTVKIQLPTAHIERMMGSSKQASDYCKKDGDFQEFGVFEDINGYKNAGAGGVQSKINYDRIISLAENHEIKKIRDEEPGVYFRGYHTIKRIAMDNPLPVKDLDVLDNEWIWGASGLGKSRTARLENPGYYIKSHNKWWLGYKGEDTILIDDVSKTERWLGEFLKQWADHYPIPTETKGDGMVVRPKRIIVTSNYSIEDIWGDDPHLCEALNRRFKIRHVVAPFPCAVPGWVPPQPAIVIPDDDDYSEVEISTDEEELEYRDEPSMEY